MSTATSALYASLLAATHVSAYAVPIGSDATPVPRCIAQHGRVIIDCDSPAHQPTAFIPTTTTTTTTTTTSGTTPGTDSGGAASSITASSSSSSISSSSFGPGSDRGGRGGECPPAANLLAPRLPDKKEKKREKKEKKLCSRNAWERKRNERSPGSGFGDEGDGIWKWRREGDVEEEDGGKGAVVGDGKGWKVVMGSFEEEEVVRGFEWRDVGRALVYHEDEVGLLLVLTGVGLGVLLLGRWVHVLVEVLGPFF